MRRRFLAFVVTLLVAIAPQTLAICRFACAASTINGPESVKAHDGHSCAHESPDSNAVRLQASPHACGHADQIPDMVERSISMTAVPPAIVASVFLPPLLEISGTISLSTHEKSPGYCGLIAPLRI